MTWAWWTWLVDVFGPPIPHPAPVPIPGPLPRPPVFETDGEMLDELNNIRQQFRLKPFMPHGKLDLIAFDRADGMRQIGVLSHKGFDEEVAARFPHSTTAENIAEGQHTAAEVVSDWMHETPDAHGRRRHRENILGAYKFVGCGRSGSFYCVDFLGHLS